MTKHAFYTLTDGTRLCQLRVSPLRASAWLEHNFSANRNVRASTLSRYVRDMCSGNWRVKPFAEVMFDVDGVLINGQHTLTALIRADVTLTLLVAYDVPRSVVDVIDHGANRSLADSIKIAGLPLSKWTTAVARVVAWPPLRGAKGLQRSLAEMVKVCDTHHDAIAWVESYVSQVAGDRSHIPASVWGLLARATYTVDEAAIGHFINVLITGVVEGDDDSSIIALRDLLLRGGVKLRNREGARYVFTRAQYALREHLRGTRPRALRSLDSNAFPIPQDAADPQ